ncbi:MAG: N-formylglutamate amidohydrolase [Nitrospirae bacterium]|nr:N-formylglutamate amidohydrolase [Nitrospirota bacterium]
MNKQFEIIISCEHGGNLVPQEYVHLFKGKEKLLNSHKGFDIGSYELAGAIAEYLGVRCYYSEITRLLVDLNRSLKHPNLFSDISRKSGSNVRADILKKYYHSYRNVIESVIADKIHSGKNVLHIAVHTFTPVLNGVKRNADIGLLYDPLRTKEKEFCIRLQKALSVSNPGLVVRRNYPYLGKTDGLVTYFRKNFPQKHYLGIELEVNQKYSLGNNKQWNEIQENIIKAVNDALLCK